MALVAEAPAELLPGWRQLGVAVNERVALRSSVELSFQGACLMFLCQSVSFLRINRSTGCLIRRSHIED